MSTHPDWVRQIDAELDGELTLVDTTVRALEELRAHGYHDLTVYTPLPVHEIEEVLERGRPVSRRRGRCHARGSADGASPCG